MEWIYKMKNINIFSTAMFPYLEGEEIKDTTLTLTIKDIKLENLKGHAGKEETKEVLYFQETTKGFVLNKTNAKRIAQLYGAMTGEWEGKQITLYTESVQAFGELHNALRVTPTSSPPNGNMNLTKLQENLRKVERIRDFYKKPNDILACQAEGTEVPAPDDLDGWRNLFTDARDYALDKIEQSIEEGDISPDQVSMPQETAIPAVIDDVEADELTVEYPEIFNGE